MADATPARGLGDTAAHRRRAADPSRKVFRAALVVALLLHLPLTPTQLAAWVHRALFGWSGDYDDRDAQAIIPIDLDLSEDPNDSPAARAAKASAEAPPETAARAVGEGISDAGADASGLGGDAAAPKPRKAPPPPPPDAGDDAGVDAGPPPLRDPVAAAGAAGNIAAKSPNVQILIDGKVLRGHELGAWFGRLLVNIPEWTGFFGAGAIDPIRDVDHLLITAPQLRGDTTRMVAVMELNLTPAKVREAVDQLVTARGGEWLDGGALPSARASIDGASRLFAVVPGRRIVVVIPEDAKDQLDRLKSAKGFRSSKVGIVISLVTPARPFKGSFPLPESLKWMRLALTPTPDGADVVIECGDKSAEEATAHAAEITRQFEQRRKLDIGITVVEVVPPTTFTARGAVIRGSMSIPAAKLRMILSFFEKNAKDRLDAGAAAPAR